MKLSVFAGESPSFFGWRGRQRSIFHHARSLAEMLSTR